MLAELGPVAAPLSTSDEELVARIDRIVRCRTGGRIRDFRVEAQGDQIILWGTAATYYAKQLATHAALDELAGRRLNNAIDVS